jgi:signal transduction histidine kinase
LQERREQLAAADRRKDEFLAAPSHELRNSLGSLRNALHLLRLQGAGGGPGGPALELADRQVGQTARLVDDLLDLSRVRQGKVAVRLEKVDVAAAAARAAEDVRPLIEARRHQIEPAGPPEPVFVKADSARFERILNNLLNNAAKFTEPGGRITVNVGRENGAAVARVRDRASASGPKCYPRYSRYLSSRTGRASPRAGWASGWRWSSGWGSCTAAP